MSWQRHMKLTNPNIGKEQNNSRKRPISGSVSTNYSSYLPAVYTGLTNRTDRYIQYDQMDQDPEIRTALNIIADFCTQSLEDGGLPFSIKYKEDMGDTEVSTLEDRLESWTDLNQFKLRIYEIVRGILKYGDQFFIRDPETFEWYWVNPANVEGIFVNQSTGKTPVIYYVRDVSLNLHDKVMTNVHLGADKMQYPSGTNGGQSAYSNSQQGTNAPIMTDPFGVNQQQGVIPVAAEHMIHLSMNTGQDGFWPFGTSILEKIFKVFKQKELLEDSIIIYRVQRAPERRVFKIDTGDMNTQQSMSYVERFKNEIHQRRIPSAKGGSTSLMDAAYNPLSILEDYFFPQSADGRGSSVETLPGGDNLGQIDDLRYFNNQLIRGLQIPASYLPMGPDDGGVAMFGDGATQAMASELRFNNECKRYQRIIGSIFDKEFKRFMIKNGYSISTSAFEVMFNPPINFASYRKAEMDAKLINTYIPLNDLSYISKQFILDKMGLSREDIIKNEKYWLQERPDAMQGNSSESSSAGLQSVGINEPNSPEMDLGIDADGELANADQEQMDADLNNSIEGFDPNSLGSSF